VTLTFEEMTWFLDATKCCYEIDMCAKLFQNPSKRDKVTVRTCMCIFKLFSRERVPSNYKCDLDLEGSDTGLCCDTSS
jgi:hypothetical protein